MKSYRQKDVRDSYLKSPFPRRVTSQTIPERIRELADEDPEKVAYVFLYPGRPRDVLTRREWVDRSTLVAKQLVLAGIRVGDRVPVLLASGKSWLIVQLGLYMSGATAINCGVVDSTKLLQLVNNLKCPAYICEEELTEADSVSRSTEEFGTEDKRIFVTFTQNSQCPGKLYDVETVLSHAPEKDISLPELDSDCAACAISTSGSSGEQKLVVHTHKSILFASYNNSEGFGPDSDVFVNDRPMVWFGGYPYCFLAYGSTTVYVHLSINSDKDNAFFVDVLSSEAPQAVLLMGHRLNSLKKDPELFSRLPKLRFVLTGGERLRVTTVQDMLQISPKVHSVYACIESLNFFTTTLTPGMEFREGMVGSLTAGCEAKVVDDTGLTVAIGEEGELCLKGPGTAKELICADGRSVTAVDEYGWHHTGDLAVIQSDGTAYVKGRKIEVIKRATVKIFPSVIEKELGKILDVIEVVAVGVPNDILNQEVCVCMIPKPDSDLTVEEVRRKAAQIFQPSLAPDGLGHMPGFFLFMEEFPRTEISSKCKRSALALKAQKLLGKN